MGSRLLHTRFRFIPREQAIAAQRPYTRREQLLTIVLFILPGALIYTLFLIVPIVQAGYYSLYNWNGLGPLTDFVGFDNYTRAFQHNIFQNSIINTLTITALSLIVQLPLALILAIMVGRKLPGRVVLIRLVQYTFLIVLSAIVLGPILTAVFGGLKTTGELFNEPFGLPLTPRWENYTDILRSETFWRQLVNSAIIVFGTVSITVTTSALLAFVFSRLMFPGRELIFNFFTLGLLFPVTIAFLPVFIQIRQLGLINNPFGIILPLVAFGIPGSTLILRGFFRAIPSELEDAAYIDGCGTLGFFWYVLLPLARPSLGAVVVLQTIVAWNEYFLPLLVLTDSASWPLTLGIMQFQGQYGTDWGRVMAFVSLLIVPATLFYMLTQRYIVTGLTGGELKG